MEIPCKIPGNAILLIQVLETTGELNADEVIAQTKIDLEDRYFNRKWHNINKDYKE